MGPESLKETIVGGRPAMPSFNELSPAELDALVAFLGNPTAAPMRGRGPAPARPRHRRAVQSSRPAAHRAAVSCRLAAPAE